MFERFKHQKQASTVFTSSLDDGNSSDTISWSGSAPSSPKSPERKPVTSIPETPPQGACRVSCVERIQPCAVAAAGPCAADKPCNGTPTASFYSKRKLSLNNGCATVREVEDVHPVEEQNGDQVSCYVVQLVEMFPEVDQDHLRTVLDDCRGDMELAVQRLLAGQGQLLPPPPFFCFFRLPHKLCCWF